jgi:hypothetical protein
MSTRGSAVIVTSVWAVNDPPLLLARIRTKFDELTVLGSIGSLKAILMIRPLTVSPVIVGGMVSARLKESKLGVIV